MSKKDQLLKKLGGYFTPEVISLMNELFTNNDKKRAVYYIGGQDETSGFTDVVKKENNTGVEFSFARAYEGGITCTGFDKTKHILIGLPYDNQTSTCTFNGRADALKIETRQNGVLYDYAFQFGGWIIIEELD